MGSYLSKPVTDKVSSDEAGDKLNYGASCMQGWRTEQEDAHNCILDFDKNTSLFAVYDGHGGPEVAVYCSRYLPEFIRETEKYKSDNLEEALVDAFLGLDAKIATPKVIAELKTIRKEVTDANISEDEEGSDEEENVVKLYKEAEMPLEEVIEKYTLTKTKHLQQGDGDAAASPKLKPKSNSSKSGCSSVEGIEAPDAGTSSSDKDNSKEEGPVQLEAENNIEKDDSVKQEDNTKKEEMSADDSKKQTEQEVKKSGASPNVSDGNVETPSQNGDVAPQQNGEVAKKRKGKALAKTKGVKEKPKRVLIQRSSQQLYKMLLANTESDEDDDDDEEDKTFQGPTEESSDDDDESPSVNTSLEDHNSEDASDEEEDEEDVDEEESGEDEEQDVLDENALEFARNMKEGPGSDSGCTAVVALLRGNQLYVANAGDSRCIVSRKGRAVEMSFDHKPENSPERNRVSKAGGFISLDGRVNGGLNLSRAIGDHAYKQNTSLSDREQMITALPDIKTLTIDPEEDEFMVLACDGIWNFMSSQDVVDFVVPRIQAKSSEKLSQICEEMFDHCLAPNTMGDGTGCDNMTAIVVEFKKQSSSKRPLSPQGDETEESAKRSKTEES